MLRLADINHDPRTFDLSWRRLTRRELNRHERGTQGEKDRRVGQQDEQSRKDQKHSSGYLGRSYDQAS
jgi:hypothetical protein